MALKVLILPTFDPNKLFEASRTLCGPIQTGTVTVDVLFGGHMGAPLYARWLWVGVSGDVTYVKYDGTAQQLPNMIAGVWHPVFGVMVTSAGTNATGLVWGD